MADAEDWDHWDTLIGESVLVWLPGSMCRTGILTHVLRDPYGAVQALVVINSAGHAVTVAWGAGVLVESAP